MHTQETKDKISQANKGRCRTEASRQKMSEARKKWLLNNTHPMQGKHFSQESRKRMSESHLGKVPSQDVLARRTDGIRKYWSTHKRTISTEQRLAISQTLKEYYATHLVTQETRVKISKSLSGKPKSLEHIAKVAAKSKGRHHTPEAKAKMRITRARQVVPFKDTKIEIKLQNILTKNSIEFEKHKAIMGQPDIFIEPNICIFCDGDYWHGIEKQKRRDSDVNCYLSNQGYQVLRFWEHEINSDIEACFDKIKTNFA